VAEDGMAVIVFAWWVPVLGLAGVGNRMKLRWNTEEGTRGAGVTN
jgi:hypothetical protein